MSHLNEKFPNGAFIQHIRLPNYLLQAGKTFVMEIPDERYFLPSFFFKLKNIPYLRNKLDLYDFASTVSSNGGFTIAYTIHKRVVKCFVARCSELDNFNKAKGTEIALSGLEGYATNISNKGCFSFPLPENWTITSLDGKCFVKNSEFPFLDFLIENFETWVQKTFKHAVALPKVEKLNGVPVLVYRQYENMNEEDLD